MVKSAELKPWQISCPLSKQYPKQFGCFSLRLKTRICAIFFNFPSQFGYAVWVYVENTDLEPYHDSPGPGKLQRFDFRMAEDRFMTWFENERKFEGGSPVSQHATRYRTLSKREPRNERPFQYYLVCDRHRSCPIGDSSCFSETWKSSQRIEEQDVRNCMFCSSFNFSIWGK